MQNYNKSRFLVLSKPGVPKPGPGDLLTCRIQFQPLSNIPVYNYQVLLNILISWLCLIRVGAELCGKVYFSRTGWGGPDLNCITSCRPITVLSDLISPSIHELCFVQATSKQLYEGHRYQERVFPLCLKIPSSLNALTGSAPLPLRPSYSPV